MGTNSGPSEKASVSLDEARKRILSKIQIGQRPTQWRRGKQRDAIFCLFMSVCVFSTTTDVFLSVLQTHIFADIFYYYGDWVGSRPGLAALIGGLV